MCTCVAQQLVRVPNLYFDIQYSWGTCVAQQQLTGLSKHSNSISACVIVLHIVIVHCIFERADIQRLFYLLLELY